MLSSLDILGPEGRIAARLDNYEHRPQQLEMSAAVSAALADGHHLVVEAGTGVGKSFSYLVPAILAVTDTEAPEDEKIRRIVISTHTITLQEQLLNKDLPLLNSVIPREFSAVLVKGRGNYISLRRLESAVRRQENLFDRQADLDELDRIQAEHGIMGLELGPDGRLVFADGLANDVVRVDPSEGRYIERAK